ncbi:hypothetical protein V7075_02170 [Neobacillus drentensis]|uniref:hypothetical protein n=1 Tax=Neobacillus drentensis TaxID=220684 RepID=UPI002FFF4F77
MIDLANQTFLKGSFTSVLLHIPLYSEGIGFVMPEVVFFMISCFTGEKLKSNSNKEKSSVTMTNETN